MQNLTDLKLLPKSKIAIFFGKILKLTLKKIRTIYLSKTNLKKISSLELLKTFDTQTLLTAKISLSNKIIQKIFKKQP